MPLLFLVAAIAALTPGDVDKALVKAREHLARAEATQAVSVLEDALFDAQTTERSGLIAELRLAYDIAAAEAEKVGKAQDAQTFRENLAILNRKSHAPKKDDATKRVVFESVPDRSFGTNQKQSPGLTRPKNEPDAIDTPRVPAPEPPKSTSPSADKTSGTTASAPDKPQPKPDIVLDDDPLEQADEAYNTKHYAEAGKIYAQLSRAGKLPTDRKQQWAYCRMVPLVQRINKKPTSPEEWRAIKAEALQIRDLAPKSNWFTTYLLDLIKERSPFEKTAETAAPSNSKAAKGADRPVYRGASPDEPPLPVYRKSNSDAAVSRAGTVDQPRDATDWEVKETPNFRILHHDSALADRVAKAAEHHRAEQQKQWIGNDRPGEHWKPACEIYLFPTTREFAQATGQPETSQGFSTMGVLEDKVVSRRINLPANRTELVDDVLPHEITHVVLADLFVDRQIPRWADEGMAILAEPLDIQTRRRDLSETIGKGANLFKLQQLMTRDDYPANQFWPIYHAQSASVTHFLVARSNPRNFVAFVRAAQRDGYEPALRRFYRIDGFDELQRLWIADVKTENNKRLARKEDEKTKN